MTVQTARNNTARWRDLDMRHHLHPFTDTRQLVEAGGSRIITKAEGVWPACGASTSATGARSWPRPLTSR
jgi:hypothetical protein